MACGILIIVQRFPLSLVGRLFLCNGSPPVALLYMPCSAALSSGETPPHTHTHIGTLKRHWDSAHLLSWIRSSASFAQVRSVYYSSGRAYFTLLQLWWCNIICFQSLTFKTNKQKWSLALAGHQTQCSGGGWSTFHLFSTGPPTNCSCCSLNKICVQKYRPLCHPVAANYIVWPWLWLWVAQWVTLSK